MARRKIAYSGAKPFRIRLKSQESLAADFFRFVVDRPNVAFEIEAFRDYFLEQVANVTVRLTASGVTAARAALVGAETPWGQARMRGSYFGTSFSAYGKGPGRYDTGNMFNALKVLETDASYGQFRLAFGYDMSMNRSPATGGERADTGGAYFQIQERGFRSSTAFSPFRTEATGRASFDRARRPKKVKGAFALPAGAESIRKRIDSAFSAAWNEAVRRFEADGFSASGVGTYIDAREAYKKNPPPRYSGGVNPAASLSTGSPASPGFPRADLSEYVREWKVDQIQNFFKR